MLIIVLISKCCGWLIPSAIISGLEKSISSIYSGFETTAQKFRGEKDAWHLSWHVAEFKNPQKSTFPAREHLFLL